MFGAIDKATSYMVQNPEHIDNLQYQCPQCGWTKLMMTATSDKCGRCGSTCTIGRWDYRIRLLGMIYRGKNGEYNKYHFPIGLLPVVQEVIEAYGETIELVGQPKKPLKTLDLTWSGPELRNYQEETITKAIAELNQGTGCILEMPTGAGKTTTALKIVETLGVKTIIIVHTAELMKQWHQVIKDMLGINAGLIGDGTKSSPQPIMIAMVQTLVNMKQFPLSNYDLMIFDECHHCPANQFYKTSMKCNSFYRLGLTATPKRTDGNELKFVAAIGQIVKTKSVIELINEGYLARPEFKFIKARTTDGSTPKTFAEAYKKQIVGNSMRNQQIASETIALMNDSRNVLIVVTQISHGKALQKLIPNSQFVHGTTKKPERDKALKDFKEKKLRCLISTILGEGVDIPGMDAIVLAAAGKSQIRLVQAIGRALRNEPGKKNPIVVDVYDSGKWLRDHSQERRMAIKETFGV